MFWALRGKPAAEVRAASLKQAITLVVLDMFEVPGIVSFLILFCLLQGIIHALHGSSIHMEGKLENFPSLATRTII